MWSVVNGQYAKFKLWSTFNTPWAINKVTRVNMSRHVAAQNINRPPVTWCLESLWADAKVSYPCLILDLWATPPCIISACPLVFIQFWMHPSGTCWGPFFGGFLMVSNWSVSKSYLWPLGDDQCPTPLFCSLASGQIGLFVRVSGSNNRRWNLAKGHW